MTGSYMLLRNAYKVYVQRENYAYFYGAKNVVLTDGVMDDLIRTYWDEHFSRYDKKQLEAIRNYSRGKIGLDCSGLITLISGIYGSSGQLYDACPKKTSIVEGKAGSLVWRPGHVGIDLGYGYCMHIPSEMHTLEIAKLQAIGFEKSGELPDYDYSEAINK